MKNKKLSLLSLVTLGSIVLSGCTIKIGDYVIGTTGTGGGEGTTKITGSYYESYKFDTLKGDRLANEIQRMCFEKHKKYITYGQVNSYYSTTSTRNSAEAIANGSKINQWFYTGKEASGYGTREHVWPCANSDQLWEHNGSGIHNVDNSSYIGAGSDLYHVRTANSSVNTKRGNSKFVDFDDDDFKDVTGIVEVGESNGKYKLKLSGLNTDGEFAQKAEPADEMKGDVARIILYVYVHYKEKGVTPVQTIKSGTTNYKLTDLTGDLKLMNIFGYDSEEKCKQCIMKWNKLDAPSAVEKLRNDTVQKIQGNRNPFVDFPDLVDKMLGY